MTHDLTTAQTAGLISCHSCHLLCQRGKRSADQACPRCGASLHDRKPSSISRTWALVLAAVIFYIPANVLPITTVILLGKAQSDTIMSGVIYFLHTGMWPIALVIFLAMVASMAIAGLAGAAIPLLLTRLGQDPAQSASIILTTVTDVVGFFSFLGLATVFARDAGCRAAAGAVLDDAFEIDDTPPSPVPLLLGREP